MARMVKRNVGRKTRTEKGKGKAVEEKTAPPSTTPAKLWEEAPDSEDGQEDAGPWYSDLQPFSVLEEDGSIKRPAGVSWSWSARKTLPKERVKSPKEMEPPAVVGHDSIWRDAKDSAKLALQKKVNSNYGDLLKKAKPDGAAAAKQDGGKRAGSISRKQQTSIRAAAAAAAKEKAKKARADDEEANTDDGEDDDNDEGAVDGDGRNDEQTTPHAAAVPAPGKKEGAGGGSSSRRKARAERLAALAAAAQKTARGVAQ